MRTRFLLALASFALTVFVACSSGSTNSPPGNNCGASGESCCGGACNSGLVCTSGVCEASTSCGASGEACCSGSCSGGLVCTSGTCQASTSCGASGEACCSSNTCNGGLTCQGIACVDVLAPSQNGPYGMAVDANNVYWLNGLDGTLDKVAITGGTPTAIVPSGIHDFGGLGGNPVATDGTYVYYWNPNSAPGTSTLNKVSVNGGTVTPLATASGAMGIAVDSTNVYFATPGTVNKVPIAGGTAATQLATGQNVYSVAVDSTSVYFTEHDGGYVSKVLISGGPVTHLASGLNSPENLVVDGTNVYWTDYNQGVVYRVPVAGGVSPTTLATGPAACIGIALQSGYVYWIDGAGEIMKVSVNGGAVTTLTKGPGGPFFAVDATSVYWDFLGSGMGSGYVDKAAN